jgi:alkanesulfonate monooxygenase SsuD/methylene tetrahydromethanopterin reductase-like flavin-dependent oxidoreductase (luciferase family)
MKFGVRYANLGRYVDGRAAVELAQAAEAAGFDSIWTLRPTPPSGSGTWRGF